MAQDRKVGLILMTALPPTRGHKALIDFAYEFMKMKDDDSRLYVIVNGRGDEPISIEDRGFALYHSYNIENISFLWSSAPMPQEPYEHPDFWKKWKDLIKENTYYDKFDYVFASEEYGNTLADVVGAQFIPYNIGRNIQEISATEIRNNPLEHFHWILPEFQKKIRQTVTIFGPESVGKTTMAKALAKECNGQFLPEWAREYLELKSVGPEITLYKMRTIMDGQQALEKSTKNLIDKPFVVRDTDLLSTYGYYELWSPGCDDSDECLDRVDKADLYILMNDEIPFTPDILRYGGDKRETKNQFWKDILDEFSCNYYEVQSLSHEAQLKEVAKVCRNLFHRKNNFIYER